MSSQALVLNLQYLASGGYGDLYVGNLSNSGMTVVVKFLREYKDHHARQVFDREIQILRRRLRGIVPLLSWNTGVERPYYLMPYLTGGHLSRYAGRLPESQLYEVALDLARTLANFHFSVGTHGDFKPPNILVSEDGRLHVADPAGNGFGCTILFSQGVRGTPAYWAPEVVVKVSLALGTYTRMAPRYTSYLQGGRHGRERDQTQLRRAASSLPRSENSSIAAVSRTQTLGPQCKRWSVCSKAPHGTTFSKNGCAVTGF